MLLIYCIHGIHCSENDSCQAVMNSDDISSGYFIAVSTQLGVGSTLPTGLSSRWPRAAQGPKFKIPLPRSFVPRPNYENVDTVPTHERMHGRTYGGTDI